MTQTMISLSEFPLSVTNKHEWIQMLMDRFDSLQLIIYHSLLMLESILSTRPTSNFEKNAKGLKQQIKRISQSTLESLPYAVQILFQQLYSKNGDTERIVNFMINDGKSVSIIQEAVNQLIYLDKLITPNHQEFSKSQRVAEVFDVLLLKVPSFVRVKFENYYHDQLTG